MPFIAEALAWNFWPRMIDTPGAGATDDGVPSAGRRSARARSRTRVLTTGFASFVEAMDRLREEPGGDDDLLLDRAVAALRPARRLGRLVVQKGPVTAIELPERPVPVGAAAHRRHGSSRRAHA